LLKTFQLKGKKMSDRPFSPLTPRERVIVSVVALVIGTILISMVLSYKQLRHPHTSSPYSFMTLDDYCAAKYQDGSLLGTVTTNTGAQQIFCVAPYDGVLITEVLRSGVVSKEPEIRQHHTNDQVVAINKTERWPPGGTIAVLDNIADNCDGYLGRMVAMDDLKIVERVDIQVARAGIFCLDDAGRLVHFDVWNKEIDRWSNFVLAERQE
jgi:hypothetical protein